jgi:hypothetical protein
MWTGHLKKKIVTAFPSVHDDICSYLSIQMQKKIFVQQGVRMCVNKDTLSSCEYLIPRWCVVSYTCNVSASPGPCSWTVPVSIPKSWSRSKSTLDSTHRTSPDHQCTGPVNPCRRLQGEIKLNTEYVERWIPKSVCLTKLLSVVKSKMVQEGVTDRE